MWTSHAGVLDELENWYDDGLGRLEGGALRWRFSNGPKDPVISRTVWSVLSLSEHVTGCFVAVRIHCITKPWYCLPRPGRQWDGRWGVAAGLRIPWGFHQSIVDHSRSQLFWVKNLIWPSKFEFTTSGCFWDHFFCLVGKHWKLNWNGEQYVSCPFE